MSYNPDDIFGFQRYPGLINKLERTRRYSRMERPRISYIPNGLTVDYEEEYARNIIPTNWKYEDIFDPMHIDEDCDYIDWMMQQEVKEIQTLIDRGQIKEAGKRPILTYCQKR